MAATSAGMSALVDKGATLAKNGYFSELPFISINDPYNNKDPLASDRHKGKQILAHHPKTGEAGRLLT